MRLLRNYGQRIKNQHDLLGYNCRLDTLQACVLLTKMKYIEDWTEQRRQVAEWYREELSETNLILPVERDEVRHVYHLYVARYPQRDELIKHLAERNISCGVHYPNPLFTAQPFRESATFPLDLPICSQFANEIMSLPMYPEMTRNQVSEIGEAIRAFCLQEIPSS